MLCSVIFLGALWAFAAIEASVKAIKKREMKRLVSNRMGYISLMLYNKAWFFVRPGVATIPILIQMAYWVESVMNGKIPLCPVSTRWPLHLAASQQVQMQVTDFLPAIAPAVDDGAVAVVGNALLPCNQPGGEQQFACQAQVGV